MALTRIGKITFNAGENSLRRCIVDLVDSVSYWGCYTVPARVVKVDLNTFSRVGALTLDAGEDYPQSFVIDPSHTYMYVALDGTPGKVKKIRLSDFTKVSTLTLPANYNYPRSLVMNPSGSYLYIFCGTTTYRLVRVDLSSFSVYDYINLPLTGAPQYDTGQLKLSSSLAYVGGSTIKLGKVNLATFSEVAAVAPAFVSNIQCSAIDILSGVYFWCTAESPGKISRFLLSSFTSPDYITLNAGENAINAAKCNAEGGLLYAVCRLSQTIVVRVAVSTFSRLDALTLPAGDSWGNSVLIDDINQFLYVGTDTSPGSVIKLSDPDIVPSGGPQYLPLVGVG